MPRSLDDRAPVQDPRLHFTNREEEQQALLRLLDLPAGTPLPVLMFYGVGGNGKSWLLRKLRDGLPPGLPSALLDLEPNVGGTPYHTDSTRALAELRRQLEGVAFPRFDLAYAWVRFKDGTRDEPLLRGSGPTAWLFEMLVEGVPSLADGLPLASWILKQGAKLAKLGSTTAGWRHGQHPRCAKRMLDGRAAPPLNSSTWPRPSPCTQRASCRRSSELSSANSPANVVFSPRLRPLAMRTRTTLKPWSKPCANPVPFLR